jgi:hypothetical protein
MPIHLQQHIKAPVAWKGKIARFSFPVLREAQDQVLKKSAFFTLAVFRASKRIE